MLAVLGVTFSRHFGGDGAQPRRSNNRHERAVFAEGETIAISSSEFAVALLSRLCSLTPLDRLALGREREMSSIQYREFSRWFVVRRDGGAFVANMTREARPVVRRKVAIRMSRVESGFSTNFASEWGVPKSGRHETGVSPSC